MALQVPLSQLDDYLGSEPLAAFTRHTITDRALLRTELADIRRLGYAINMQEVVDGACGVSAPIFDARERFAGSLTIGIPEVRFNARKQLAIDNIMDSVSEISRRLGNRHWSDTLKLFQDAGK